MRPSTELFSLKRAIHDGCKVDQRAPPHHRLNKVFALESIQMDDLEPRNIFNR